MKNNKNKLKIDETLMSNLSHKEKEVEARMNHKILRNLENDKKQSSQNHTNNITDLLNNIKKYKENHSSSKKSQLKFLLFINL